MTIRIGANPIGWPNDDVRELGGETPLKTCLAEAREAGFEGMELGHKFPRDPAALREGVRLVYHHHMGTVVQSEDDIHVLMAATGPAVGLLLDTGHATWGGADPAQLARRYRGRIAHVHAKDVRPDVMARARAEDWSFLRAVVEGVYTVPGDGVVDYPAVFRALPGYAGWVVIEAEQDPARANPLAYATLGYANLRRCLADAGLRQAA